VKIRGQKVFLEIAPYYLIVRLFFCNEVIRLACVVFFATEVVWFRKLGD
jgi:hypothetical protein